VIAKGLKNWNVRFGIGVPPSSGLREALQWLMLGRLGVLYVLLAALVIQQVIRGEGVSTFELSLAYGLLALGFGFNLLFSLLIERFAVQWWVAGLHILFDGLVTSVWIYFSNGGEGLFALLYLIQILLVALVLF